MTLNEDHVGSLQLRRLFAGELPGTDAERTRAHAAGCDPCRAKLRGIEEDQRRFEQEIPFERFAAGVERAARRAPRAAPTAPSRWRYAALGMAAALVLSVGTNLIEADRPSALGLNRLKGGATFEMVVAGPLNGPQRQASPNPLAPEPLSNGERVRIGYLAGAHRFVTSLSIDEQGQVTPLYPESGASLPITRGDAMTYLPQSVEFTGDGTERVVVILSDEPLQVEQVTRAAQRAFAKQGGDLTRLDRLELPGEQFHRTFLKP